MSNALMGIVTLLSVVTLGLVITRVATVALTLTGLSRDLARFQSRSAFTGCGFTTHESESIVEHPVRRRIVMLLMLLGNGTVVMAISSLIPVFVDRESTPGGFLASLLWLILGLLVLWFVASSSMLDRQMTRLIGWALARFTRLEVYDYHGMLHFSEGYTVSELTVDQGHWLTGKNLITMRLPEEGTQVLGIHRANGQFVGTPTGTTYIRSGDRLILYGREENLSELTGRQAGSEGDRAHEKRVAEQAAILEQQEDRERTRQREREDKATS